MINLGKEMERSRDKAGTVRAALTSAKAKVHRLASDIDGVMERSEGFKTESEGLH